MRILSIITFSLISLFSISQEPKEYIKIDVDKDCKGYVSKRTYKGEIYTHQIKIAKGFGIEVNLSFAYNSSKYIYDNKQKHIYLNLNEEFFELYDSRFIYLDVNGKEFKIDGLTDFIKTKYTGVITDSEYQYSLGFNFNDSLVEYIKNASTMTFRVYRHATKTYKEWELSSSTVEDIVKSYNCFEKYYLPLYDKQEQERLKKEKEYQESLKSYEDHFRNSKWSDSKEDVLSSEQNEPVLKKDESLAYEVELNNDNFYALFYFNKDRLFQGVYTFEEEYVNENNFYEKYKEIKSILTLKYGSPKTTYKHRNKELYDKASEIGMAIQTGEYIEYTMWETKNSKITLTIEGENFESEITIRYITKEPDLLKEAQKTFEKKRMDGF